MKYEFRDISISTNFETTKKKKNEWSWEFSIIKYDFAVISLKNEKYINLFKVSMLLALNANITETTNTCQFF